MNKKIFHSNPSSGNLLIRLMVGGVFFTEGIQKLMFPAAMAAGRFTQIGIPSPEFFGLFVGYTEIICGFLLLIGLITRIAAIPLLIDIVVAIYTTKIPILMHKGFWSAIHEARTDLCMLLGLIFLLSLGSGKWSFDNKISKGKS